MAWILKWKIWQIEIGLKRLLKKAGVKPIVWSLGAYHIDPKHLVFVVGVPFDSERDRLRRDSSFLTAMRNLLVEHNWPRIAREHIHFDIESQETVDRETNGNWWYHYK